MSNNSSPSNINQTFIIEPLALTGGTSVISACTTVYTNELVSCSGDTTIFMGNGVISFDGNIYTNQNISASTINASTFISGGTNILNLISAGNITGGTFNNSTDTLTLHKPSGQIIVTGFTDYYTTGATLVGNTVYFNRTDALSAYTLSLTAFSSTNTYTTGLTFSNNEIIITRNDGVRLNTFINLFTGLTVNGNLLATTISATTYLGLPTDITITGGTYSAGTAVFTNNTGGTFNISGFSTGNTNTTTVTQFTGGTVTGTTQFIGGITANTISATTYLGLPVDIRVTGGTSSRSNNSTTITFTNNTGGTFSVTGLIDTFVTGGTYSAGTAVFTNNTGGTFSITGFITGTTSSNTSFSGWTGSTSVNSIIANNGTGNVAGVNAVAEGNATKALGNNSHAEGNQTTAIGGDSHAEGQSTTANGAVSHAEGAQTYSYGDISHAEGYQTLAGGAYSHSENIRTQALGVATHAEGDSTTAIGGYSHVGGFNSIAVGDTSFIHSINSIVTGDRSVVIGGQGISGSSSDTVYTPALNIIGLNDDIQLKLKAYSAQTQPLVYATDNTNTELFRINTDSIYNLFIGNNSGLSNSAVSGGLHNYGLGFHTLKDNIDGFRNIAIGSYSQEFNLHGTKNVSLGYGALYNNKADNNSAVGDQALFNNTTGVQNMAFGSNAMYGNTSGSYNVGVGVNALSNNQTGSFNICIGSQAGGSVTSDDNTIIGVQAGLNLTTGAANVFIGRGAGGWEMGSNRLYISNNNTSTPLIWGDFGNNIVALNGVYNTGLTVNTTYVNKLNIIPYSGISVASLGIDSNGFIISNSGSTGDIYITGGTYSAGTTTLKQNNGSTVIITGYTNTVLISSSAIFNFGDEDDENVLTVTGTTLTNDNLMSFTYIPSGTTETSLSDFKLNGVSFNIENIIDNVSFDIRGTALNSASGNYTIKYKITHN